MPEDEIVDVRMRLQILLGKQHQVLFVLTHIRRFLTIHALHPTHLSPLQSEPHRPTGMQRAEQSLTGTVMEDTLEHLEFFVRITQSVAMSHEEHLSPDLRGQRLFMQDHPTLLFQVTIHPDVMVAGEVMHLHTGIRKF